MSVVGVSFCLSVCPYDKISEQNNLMEENSWFQSFEKCARVEQLTLWYGRKPGSRSGREGEREGAVGEGEREN